MLTFESLLVLVQRTHKDACLCYFVLDDNTDRPCLGSHCYYTNDMANPLASIKTLDDLLKLRDEVVRGPSVGSTPAQTNPSTSSTPTSPTPTSTTEAPPLQHLETPRNNIFLKHRKPTVKGFASQWTDAQYQQAATLAANLDTQSEKSTNPHGLKWTTAANTHFADRNYSPRLTTDLKRMTEVLIFRHGSLLEHHYSFLIGMLPKNYANGSNIREIRKNLGLWQTQAKANTQSFLYLSMKQLLVEVPDFRYATDEARTALLVRMFNQAKIVISENLFYIEAQSVNIANIFRSNGEDDDVRVRWQRLLRSRFVHLALQAYHTRIVDEGRDPKGARERLGHCIDTHMSGADVRELDLGTYMDVPTTAHRSVVNKRHMPKLVVVEDDDDVVLM